jgi:cyclase
VIDLPYTHGLHDLGHGAYAWTEPDGSWGWSNAGLVTGSGAALLVDTLFDVRMTREMLEAMAPITAEHPIKTVFNTHANGDHWFGNQLLAGAEIITTKATAEEMPLNRASDLNEIRTAEGPAGDFARAIFGPFDWSDLEPTYPTRTFEGSLTLDVGGTEVQLIQVGPAHTLGDAIAYVPSASVLYTGDMLFVGGTPVAWEGPIQGWIDACDLMINLGAEIIVPGHGPVTDETGVRQVQHYLEYVLEQATAKFHAGVPPIEAAGQIPLDEFASWNEGGRIVQNVLNIYYELDPTMPRIDRHVVFANIAALEGHPALPC